MSGSRLISPARSLRTKIVLVSSLLLAVLFAATAAIVQQRVTETMSRSLEAEAQASVEAYRSLWKARADRLGAVSLALSGMSDVRAALGTGDAATISDLARERWAKLSDKEAFFIVADPTGRILASFSSGDAAPQFEELASVRNVSARFPSQVSGFLLQNDRLYQVVMTPVYVQSVHGPALLDVFAAGYAISGAALDQLKTATGGSEFIFTANEKMIAGTLPAAAAASLSPARGNRVAGGGAEYVSLEEPLLDVEGRTIGKLQILRSFWAAEQAIRALREGLLLVWAAAVAVGILLSYVLARRLTAPVARLDRAAAEIARQNYDYRVPVESEDELGRLAAAFNAMCDSIQRGRDELVRSEQLATIGRLSTSLVHDLRNPLAAIYAGSEMLAEGTLPPQQTVRLAGNIHRASHQIQSMLKELTQVARGKTAELEVCPLTALIQSAWELVAPAANANGVELSFRGLPDAEVTVERMRVQRVFVNLFVNSIEAMQNGGRIDANVRVCERGIEVVVQDNGPGIAGDLRARLFQPFVSAGKRNGIGLGLALSRQTMRDHEGDLKVDFTSERGARFVVWLPPAAVKIAAAASEA